MTIEHPRGQAAGGVRITLIGQWVKFATQSIGFVALSRLLSPEDFGLLAVSAVVIAAAGLLADLGLSLAAVRSQALSEVQQSTLFWLNTLAGLAGAAIVASLGPALADFYDDRRVTQVMLVLSLSLLFSGLAVQFRVTLNRHGRFAALAAQDAAAPAISISAAIIAASLGFGYWSLVIPPVLSSFLLAIMAIGSARWRPSLQFSLRSSSSLLGFGGNSFAVSILNLASRTVDIVALGRSQSKFDVGLYSRSSQLISLVFQQLVTPLTRVILPRLAASDSHEFPRLMHRLQLVISWSLVPALFLLFAIAPSGLELALGDEWRGAAIVTQILAVGGIFAAWGYVFYWAYLAKGEARTLLWVELPGRAIMMLGAAIGAQYGVVETASAVVVGQFLTLALSFVLVSKLEMTAKSIIVPAIRPTVVFTTATTLSLCFASRAGGGPGVSTTVAVATWLGVVSISGLYRPVRNDLRSALETVLRRAAPSTTDIT